MKQKGEATMLVLAISALIGTGWMFMAPTIGRFQTVVTPDGSVIVTDTATRQMERCSLVGATVVCKQIVAQQ